MKPLYIFSFFLLPLFFTDLQAQAPAGTETRIVLRCGLVRTNVEPLYILDGMPMENADFIRRLNPHDIRSIDILKDAAAQAIYGCRASSGVIIITTHSAGERRLRVTDFVDGSPVARASVQLINRATKDTLNRMADDSGLIVLKGLDLSADWQVQITATGYNTLIQGWRRGQFPVRHEFKLSRVATPLETVVVKAFFTEHRRCTLYCRCGGVRISSLKAGQTDQGKPEPAVGRVYPNPLARGQQLCIPVRADGIRSLQVLDAQGRIIREERFNVPKGGTYLLSTDARWSAGLYWLRIMGAGPVPVSVQTVMLN